MNPVRAHRWTARAVCLGLIFLLAACQAQPTQVPPTSSPASPTAQPSLTPSLTPSFTPSAPRATLTPLPTPTPSPTPAPPHAEDWTLYTNPNNVRGLAVVKDHLWAATMGGVVDWDLASAQPKLYTTLDGLGEIQANDIVYCPVKEDRLYVGHENGAISSFDLGSQQWSPLPVELPEGQNLGAVQSLFCDPGTYRLYAAGKSSLGILNLASGEWSYIGKENGLNSTSIRSVSASGQTIWLAAGDQGAFLVLGNKVFPFNSQAGFPAGAINDVALMPDGGAWFAYPYGLIQFNYQDKTWTPYRTNSPTGLPFSSVDRVEVGPDNQVWIASSNEGVCPFDPFHVTCATLYPVSKHYSFTDLAVDAKNVAYTGTNGQGIFLLMPDSLIQLLYPTQMVDNHINALVEDDARTLWAVTNRGVSRLNLREGAGEWSELPVTPTGLVSSSVMGAKSLQGGVWFFYGDQNQGSFFDGDQWTQVSELQGLTGVIRDAAVDSAGLTWLITDTGLFRWNGSRLESASDQSDLPLTRLNVLHSREGEMWVGSQDGLWKCQQLSCKLAVPDLDVLAIAENGPDELLLGTDQGLIRYSGGQAYIWAINLGEQTYLDTEINCVARDLQGRIWVGSAKNGLFVLSGDRWDHFTTLTGLPTNTIQSILVDHQGTVWISAVTQSGGGALVQFK